MMKKRLLLQLTLVGLLAACGGGGGSSDGPTPTPQRLVGEIFGTPEQVATSDLVTNAGYGGYGGALETSRAIQKAGKTNMLDFLFLFNISDKGAARLVSDAPAVLEAYIAKNADLLQPGVYVYLLDEMYLKASLVEDDPAEYQAQLDDLKRAAALVRQRLPQVKLGLSFSPHATFGHPKVMPFIAPAIAQVDWVGTTTYWLGDKTTTSALHDWSRALPGLARAAQPRWRPGTSPRPSASPRGTSRLSASSCRPSCRSRTATTRSSSLAGRRPRNCPGRPPGATSRPRHGLSTAGFSRNDLPGGREPWKGSTCPPAR